MQGFTCTGNPFPSRPDWRPGDNELSGQYVLTTAQTGKKVGSVMTNTHSRADRWDDCPDRALDYIADMLGTGFRDKMIATMGGTEIKVPVRIKTLTDEHHLVRHLGRIDAEELVDTVPGEIIYIPHAAKPNPTRDRVALLVKAGKTSDQIAHELGITARQVRRLRTAAGLNGHQIAKRLGVSFQGLSDAIRAASPRLLAAE